MNRPIRIANISGFYGDRASAGLDMLAGPDPVDVLSGDYLAELTMLILWKARRKDPSAGYARTFLTQLEGVLGTCLDRGVKIVVNAGGLNPTGLAERVTELADRLGIGAQVGVVLGDDVLDRFGQDEVLTANAYLGGFGISACLTGGADIVVTGRVTDAALVVGPAAWWHGWQQTDWDRIAGAIVAGHVIECGPQATGGNYSFLDELPNHRYPGSPIAEVEADGSCVITKQPDTGGVVTVGTVTAQLLYEIDTPAYANPDAVAHFDSLRLEQSGPDRVRISGVRGSPPPDTLKVALNSIGGWRNTMTLVLTGLELEAKASRAVAMLDESLGGFDQFDDHHIELVMPGRHELATNVEDTAMLRITVKDRVRERVDRRFSSAFTELLLASYAGAFTTTPPLDASEFGIYRPAVVDLDAVVHRAILPNGEERTIAHATPVPRVPDTDVTTATTGGQQPDWGPTRAVSLGLVCGARSGDKGGNANVGLWTRSDIAFQWLRHFLDVQQLRMLLPEAADLRIRRHELPNLRALNFVVDGLLGDGVASTTRFDPQAKGLGEHLRAKVVDIPVRVLAEGKEGSHGALS